MDPELYAKGNQIAYRNSLELITKYMPMIKRQCTKNQVALDIGCGTGNVTWEILRPLLPEGIQLFGADIQPKMIEFAKEKYPELQSFVLDIGASKISEHLKESFHYIFSFYCLMLTKDIRQTMQNIYNMLKPEGQIFTYFFGSHVFLDTFYKLSTTKKWNNYMPDITKIMNFYDFDEKNLKEKLHNILQDIGFQISICEVEFTNFTVSNIDELKNYFRGVCPNYMNLPENLKADLINDAFEILYQHKIWKETNAESSELLIPHRLIIILAVKPK